jgi:hypothetical protein
MQDSPPVRRRARQLLACLVMAAVATALAQPTGLSVASPGSASVADNRTAQWCDKHATQRPESLHVRYAKPHDRSNNKVIVRVTLRRLRGCRSYGLRTFWLSAERVRSTPNARYPHGRFHNALKNPVRLAHTDRHAMRRASVKTLRRSSCHIPPSSGAGPAPVMAVATFVSNYHKEVRPPLTSGLYSATFKRPITGNDC